MYKFLEASLDQSGANSSYWKYKLCLWKILLDTWVTFLNRHGRLTSLNKFLMMLSVGSVFFLSVAVSISMIAGLYTIKSQY